jgi:hypothetical protein
MKFDQIISLVSVLALAVDCAPGKKSRRERKKAFVSFSNKRLWRLLQLRKKLLQLHPPNYPSKRRNGKIWALLIYSHI